MPPSVARQTMDKGSSKVSAFSAPQCAAPTRFVRNRRSIADGIAPRHVCTTAATTAPRHVNHLILEVKVEADTKSKSRRWRWRWPGVASGLQYHIMLIRIVDVRCEGAGKGLVATVDCCPYRTQWRHTMHRRYCIYYEVKR